MLQQQQPVYCASTCLFEDEMLFVILLSIKNVFIKIQSIAVHQDFTNANF